MYAVSVLSRLGYREVRSNRHQEILGEARKMARSKDLKKDITLRVNQEIARKLKSRDNNYIQEIEQILRGHVLVRSDVSLHREHFDID